MERIGATDDRLLAPRPKFMRRMTYDIICDEIHEHFLAMWRLCPAPEREEEIEDADRKLAERYFPHILFEWQK